MHPTLLTLNTIVFLLVVDYKRIWKKSERVRGLSNREAALDDRIAVIGHIPFSYPVIRLTDQTEDATGT